MTTIVHGQNVNEHQTFSKIERVNNLESESGVPSSPVSMVGGISSYPMDRMEISKQLTNCYMKNIQLP